MLHRRFTHRFTPLFLITPFVFGAGVLAAFFPSQTHIPQVGPHVAPRVDSLGNHAEKIDSYLKPRPTIPVAVVMVGMEGGTSRAVAIGGIMVSVKNVRDSRCPVGTICVRAGGVMIDLAITDRDGMTMNILDVEARTEQSGELSPVAHKDKDIFVTLLAPAKRKVSGGDNTPFVFRISVADKK